MLHVVLAGDLALADCVSLWRLRFDAAEEHGDRLAALSAAERGRAARLADPRARRRFVQARGALRELLGAHLGRPARSIAIEQGADGKPALAGRERLWFNVSHTEDVAVIALSGAGPVGVDVQRLREGHDVMRLAPRVLHESELAALAGMTPGLARETFLRFWVVKEAVVKALGIGIWGNTTRVVLDLGLQRGPTLSEVPGAVPAQEWSLSELCLEPGVQVASAVPRRAVCVRGIQEV